MDYVTITTILTALPIIIYFYFKWAFSYWKRRGVPYSEPIFPYGNIREPIMNLMSMGDTFMKVYQEAKSKGHKHVGFYMAMSPTYVPIDLDIIKNIVQKDYNYFLNRGMYVNEEDDPLTGHLFNLEDEKWKYLRMKFTPLFTAGECQCKFFYHIFHKVMISST